MATQAMAQSRDMSLEDIISTTVSMAAIVGIQLNLNATEALLGNIRNNVASGAGINLEMALILVSATYHALKAGKRLKEKGLRGIAPRVLTLNKKLHSSFLTLFLNLNGIKSKVKNEE